LDIPHSPKILRLNFYLSNNKELTDLSISRIYNFPLDSETTQN